MSSSNAEPRGTLGNPLRVSAAQRAMANGSQSSPSAPFFGPFNANQPFPLGINSTIPLPRRASFWSDTSTSRFGPMTSQQLPNTACNARDGSLPSGFTSGTSFQNMSTDEFAQLNQDLTFIEENDEHAYIASGDNLIDSSLAEEVSANDDFATGVVEAETQSTEALDKSALHKQLLAMKDRLSEEEETFGKPLCYLRGDFYDRPPHPSFGAKLKD
ncbi:hypothetical protein B0H11DRAFT_1901300 [Mycena galericulata]|nr:hypothetical protein B0H11DRAFT_1901300 [Mycena galericulata]